MLSIALPHPLPWRVKDTGSAFGLEDASGRALAFVYYRRDGALNDINLPVDQARAMAQELQGYRRSKHRAHRWALPAHSCFAGPEKLPQIVIEGFESQYEAV